MKVHNFTLVHLITLSTLLFDTTLFVNSQEFHTSCSFNQSCTPGKFLTCNSNNLCDCEDPETQIYDAIEGQCVIVAGKNCVPGFSTDIPLCIQGAECNTDKNVCECSKGFYETELNICAYTIGKICRSNADCDGDNGLVCGNGVCRCPNSSYVWQMEYGCVNTEEIEEDAANVTSTSTDSSSIIFINSEIPSIAPNNSAPIDNNNITDNEIPEEEEIDQTTIMTINSTELGGSNSNSSQPDLDQDRNGFPSTSTSRSPLANFVNQIIPPILNPLNPNHPLRPARPTFVPASAFSKPIIQQVNNNNMVVNNGVVPPVATPQVQLPSNVVPNIFRPAPISGNFANPNSRPLDFFNLRRVLHPIKRFLFPRLFAPRQTQPGDVELPSPIYIAVSSINRILPILRVIDYQMSPVLENLAAITRPRYLDRLVQENHNYNINNNNLQQLGQLGQVQQLVRTDNNEHHDYLFTDEELQQVQPRRRNPLFNHLQQG